MTKDPLNMAEAEELVDEEVRAIFAENPKAKKSDKLLRRLLIEACLADKKLNHAVLYLVAADIRRRLAN
jgi:hypothetical protein